MGELRGSGKYVMGDVDEVGGIGGVMKLLDEKGLMDGDWLRVSGKSVGEKVEEQGEVRDNKCMIDFENRKDGSGGVVMLKGNVGGEGGVGRM
ncbi:dihydroxy-acid dehydratase domain-containing protein, partial [Staphylococcus saprophyticus]|uniref:dihydroxy-acid dehydratase domain-containing protein n=1 Tax=Staphylococcus saprophyticus TaxID=29385 RepID=UPI0028CB85C3